MGHFDLAPGTRLGHYEIVAPLGAGGMGEVYKAKDTRLDRAVAVKVLPSHLSDNAELKERFEREARAISSLSHPNICVLHDVGSEDGVDFLVMELLEGETLNQRLNKGALPLDDALRYGIQIADALDKAHCKGVVHRDLKPGNVVLTKPGARLLDFGLAKVAGPEAGAADSALPTQQKSLTAAGSILGTFQYMSPEQLEGRDADARTDIFAFGAMFYEMVTGKKAFEGKSQASLITAIMSTEPAPISTVQSMSPQALDHVVTLCLAKDPDERWQSAADVMRELKWIAEGGSESDSPAPARSKAHRRLTAAAVVGAVLAGIVASIVVGRVTRPEPQTPQPVTRFPIRLAPGDNLSGQGYQPVALSPDGTHLVYAANEQLYLRPLDTMEATPIRGTEGGARNPFFSPDGQWVGFFFGGSLRKISIHGGAPVTLCDAELPLGMSWESDDTIFFGQLLEGILKVSAAGGTPETVLPAERAYRHFGPQLLPGGKALLFTHYPLGDLDDGQIVVVFLESGEQKVLLEGGRDARYVPTGHLVYAREGTLMAVPFDVDRLEVTGGPVSIVEDVANGYRGAAYFSFSDTGALVYLEGSVEGRENTLVWVDRDGRATSILEPRRHYERPRLSPDGRRLAVMIGPSPGESDVWLHEMERGVTTRLTFEGGGRPLWTPDGRRIVLPSVRGEGIWTIFGKLADGSGVAEQIAGGAYRIPSSVSPDGERLIFRQMNADTGADIGVVSLGNDSDPEMILATPFQEVHATVSPDGGWMAYTSDQSGRPEVYVQSFPELGGKWQISSEGGSEPMWSHDGKELFYRHDNKMMAVAISTEPELTAARPLVLFEGTYERVGGELSTNYDVASDGRFLMVRSEGNPRATEQRINVVLNWFEELKARVPTE